MSHPFFTIAAAIRLSVLWSFKTKSFKTLRLLALPTLLALFINGTAHRRPGMLEALDKESLYSVWLRKGRWTKMKL